MKKTCVLVSALTVAGAALWASTRTTAAQQSAPAPLNYTASGELLKPADFREWVFLGSGLGMTYSPPAATAPGAAVRPPSFTNVYVNPSSYRRFMQTGAWPDQTIFILEIRASASEGSINRGGHYQAELRSIEAEVKDSTRYPGKWAYFNFGATGERAAPLPTTASCYTCHKANAAVEQTFVQFYPTLMEVARKLRTVNPSYVEGAEPHR